MRFSVVSSSVDTFTFLGGASVFVVEVPGMPVRWLAVVACAALVAAAGPPGEGRATEAADPQPTSSAYLDRSGDDYYLPGYESVHDQARFSFFDGTE